VKKKDVLTWGRRAGRKEKSKAREGLTGEGRGKWGGERFEANLMKKGKWGNGASPRQYEGSRKKKGMPRRKMEGKKFLKCSTIGRKVTSYPFRGG